MNILSSDVLPRNVFHVSSLKVILSLMRLTWDKPGSVLGRYNDKLVRTMLPKSGHGTTSKRTP